MNKNVKFAGKTFGAGLGIFIVGLGTFLTIGFIVAIILTLQAIARSGL